MAKRRGLQGGEQCPGATKYGVWEKCDVYKNGLEGIEGEWHCHRHGHRLDIRARIRVEN